MLSFVEIMLLYKFIDFAKNWAGNGDHIRIWSTSSNIATLAPVVVDNLLCLRLARHGIMHSAVAPLSF